MKMHDIFYATLIISVVDIKMLYMKKAKQFNCRKITDLPKYRFNFIKTFHQRSHQMRRTSIGLVLWNINHWRLCNAKSIFTHKNSSISNNSV